MAARPEEDVGGRGPAVRERRGALGRWVGEWRGGMGCLGQKRKEKGSPFKIDF
jgi:hypothetical protein